MDGDRERRLARAFVELADTLVDDYDVAELMHQLVEHCVTLLGASASGLLLADQRGGLRVMAASTERTRLLEVFQLQNDEGPCLDCYSSGAPVVVEDLGEEAHRWPRFVTAAQQEGFRAVSALPLRLRAETIGALNLFAELPGTPPDDDLVVAQALADVATIAILHERAFRRSELLAEQLQTALNSRVVIEQAKGVLAERGGVDMDEAFGRLRTYARSHNLHLATLAHLVVTGETEAGAVLGPGATRDSSLP